VPIIRNSCAAMLRAKAFTKPAELARIRGHNFQILKRRRGCTMSQVKSARQDQFDAAARTDERDLFFLTNPVAFPIRQHS
jgi:hypothetical protein